MKRSILVLHNLENLQQARKSALDHLLAFPRTAPEHEFCFRPVVWPVSEDVRNRAWDAVIFTSTALGIVTFRPRELLERCIEQWSFLANHPACKIMFPQDDADHGALLDDLFNRLGANVVFTVRPEFKSFIYPKASKSAQFESTFAGYLDDKTIEATAAFIKPFKRRTIVIGQRVTMYPPHGGRLGRLKGEAALAVKAAAIARGIKEDISVDPKRTISGLDWYRFLGNCRFTIGAEGGLGVWDPYGKIYDCTRAHLATNPGATFEEVEASCFPNLDGKPEFPGFAPRILESALMGCCQILVEGEYRGVLKPGIHYIPLRRDFSNMGQVFVTMKDDDLVTSLVSRCRADLIEADTFRYATLVWRVLDKVAQHKAKKTTRPRAELTGPAPTLASETKELQQREYEVGFRSTRLAARIGEIVGAQVIEPLVHDSPDAAAYADVRRYSVSLQVLAEDFAERAAKVRATGLAKALLRGLSSIVTRGADMAGAAARIARASSFGEPNADLAALAASLRGAWTDMAEAMEKFDRFLDSGASGIDTVAAFAGFGEEKAFYSLVGPELDRTPEALDPSQLEIAGKLLHVFRQGGRPAQAVSTLSHPLPENVASALNLILPASTAAGSWYPDDLERLRQARVVLGALESGGDRARLLVAIAGLDESATGIASRLAPASGDVFSAAETARLAQLDRILVRASNRSDSLDLIERVQEGGVDLESLFTAFGEGGDRARLLLALSAAGSGTAGIISRLAPATGAFFSPAEITRLEQLDRILVRAAGEPQALDYLERVQQAGDEGRSLFTAVAKGGDAAQLIKALAAAGLGIVGFASRVRPRGGAEFSPGELARLEQIDRILVRSDASGITLDRVDGIFESNYIGVLTDLAAKGPRVVELAALIDLADSHGRAADFLKALSSSRRKETLDLLGSLAPTDAGSPDWTQQQANSFQALTAIVGTLHTNLPESGEPEQNWRLLHDVAKLVVRAPRRRALIQAIVGKDTKGRRP